MGILDSIKSIIENLLSFISGENHITDIIPPLNNYVTPPSTASGSIVDIVLSFILRVFNGLMSASASVITMLDRFSYTIGVVDIDIFGLMFGVGLPIFITYTFAIWLANIVT